MNQDSNRRAFSGSRIEAETLLTYLKLMRAAESVSAEVNRNLGAYGLSRSQFAVLEALYHSGTMIQKEIAAKLFKSTGNITLVINNLLKQGMVERRNNPQDRRIHDVSLSPSGKTLVETILPCHSKSLVRRFAALTSAEQHELARLCKKLGLA